MAFVARRLLAESRSLWCSRRAKRRPCRRACPSFTPPPWGIVIYGSCWKRPAGRLDEPVLERIVAETHGNPLALLELPRGLTPTQLAGGSTRRGGSAVIREHRRRASRGGWPGFRVISMTPRWFWLQARPGGSQAVIRRSCRRAAAQAGNLRSRLPRRWKRTRAVGSRPSSGVPLVQLVRSAVYERRTSPSAVLSTAPWRTPPTPRPTLIAGPGTGPRRCPRLMKRSPRSSSVLQGRAQLLPVAGWRRSPRSSGAPPR